MLTYLPTYLLTYVRTYLLTYLLTQVAYRAAREAECQMSEITTTLMGARRQITSAARHLPAARSAAGGDADADGFENGGDPANRALLTAAKVSSK